MGVKEFRDAFESRNQATWVEVRVSPNRDDDVFPSGFDEWRGVVLARVSEPARGGDANQALLDLIEEVFMADARIVSGGHSRSKTIEVNVDVDEAVDIAEKRLG